MEIGEPGPRRKLIPLCDRIGRDQVAAVVRDFYDRLHANLPPELAQRWLQLALGIAEVMRRHLQLGG